MVCGNTAAMLGEGGLSWLAQHFEVVGRRCVAPGRGWTAHSVTAGELEAGEGSWLQLLPRFCCLPVAFMANAPNTLRLPHLGTCRDVHYGQFSGS